MARAKRVDEAAQSETPGKAPDVEYRFGPVRAALWSEKRTGDFGDFTSFNCKLERSWKDAEDKWHQEAVTLSRTEIGDAIAALLQIQSEMMTVRRPTE